jgi:phosphoglucosamine mutase
MQKRVVKIGADAGVAFDGDADRIIAADENGALIDGDKLMFICAGALKAEGRLANNLVTATVMSNIGLATALSRKGIVLQRAAVGDRYVLEMMQKTGSVLGGEQSGHIIFLDENTTGDGVFAALRFLAALAKSGKRASEIASEVTIYPQVLRNAKVKNENKYSFDKDEKIAAAIAAAEKEMCGRGRVLIRPSGTEPLVRVMLEGEDMKTLDHLAERLVRLIEDRLR